MPSAADRPDEAPDIFRPRFESCFRAHYADVLAFAIRRIQGRATAEDVVSETFAVAWRRRDRIPDPVLPWLYAIANRVLANHRRAAKRRGRLDQRISDDAHRLAGDADPADLVGERTAFHSAFSRLSEGDREVLRLVAWDGLDTRDAARVLDCTPGAYRVRLFRARRELGKQLGAVGHLPQERRPTGRCDPAEETR